EILLFHADRLRSKLGSPNGSHIAAGAGADHGDICVEFFVCHSLSFLSRLGALRNLVDEGLHCAGSVHGCCSGSVFRNEAVFGGARSHDACGRRGLGRRGILPVHASSAGGLNSHAQVPFCTTSFGPGTALCCRRGLPSRTVLCASWSRISLPAAPF